MISKRMCICICNDNYDASKENEVATMPIYMYVTMNVATIF